LQTSSVLIAGGSLLTSALLTGLVRRLALSHGVLDVPNQRSSHQTPTPRGGGAAIVAASTTALLALALIGIISTDLLWAIAGGLGVACVGFLDDRSGLSARVRLSVHILAAVWALFWLGGLPPLLLGGHLYVLGWPGYLLGTLGIVWVLNLFNFMDGIDGIAASEALFIVLAAAVLALYNQEVTGLTLAYVAFGAACCGFLLWNWPPAKIFMGDVGSGYVGYVLAVFALAATREAPVSLWSWLILGGVFFVDATVTLARRVARGERVYQAHRSHAYQWLARRWGSHRRVTIAVTLLNVLWLLPCALLATAQPDRAPLITGVALALLVIVTLAAGAGAPEKEISH